MFLSAERMSLKSNYVPDGEMSLSVFFYIRKSLHSDNYDTSGEQLRASNLLSVMGLNLVVAPWDHCKVPTVVSVSVG